MGILITIVPSEVRILRVKLYYEPHIHLFARVTKVTPAVNSTGI